MKPLLEQHLGSRYVLCRWEEGGEKSCHRAIIIIVSIHLVYHFLMAGSAVQWGSQWACAEQLRAAL